jgi:hypothetical protein
MLRVGDDVLRIVPPGEHSAAWVNPGVVKEITDTQIICEIYVDQPRTMRFARVTGKMVEDETQFIIPASSKYNAS